MLNAESVQTVESNFSPRSFIREKQPTVSSSIEEKKKKLTQAGLFQSKIPNSPGLYSSNYGVKRAEGGSAKKGVELGRFARPNIKTAAPSTTYVARSWNSSSESEPERKIKSIIKENPPLPTKPPRMEATIEGNAHLFKSSLDFV